MWPLYTGSTVYTSKTITNNNLDKKQRKRKIIWFNPPYSINVKIIPLMEKQTSVRCF